MDDDRSPAGASGSRTHPVWRLYARYGRRNLRNALLGAVSTPVGRAFGLVPAYVIGLAVDAIFLGARPYRLPLVPAGWMPETAVGQLWFTIVVLLVATGLGAVTSWLEDWGFSVFAQRVQHAFRVQIPYFPGLTLIPGVGFAVTFLVGGYWLVVRPPPRGRHSRPCLVRQVGSPTSSTGSELSGE